MKTMQRWMVGLGAAALVALSCSGAAWSQDRGAERQAVRLLLGAYDAPPDAAAYKAAAQEPEAVLLEIAGDAEEPGRVRRAALGALSRFPSAEVRALYGGILKETAAAPVGSREGHVVIMNVLAAFGEEALPEVLPLLAHPDVQVRLSVVAAVGRRGGAAGLQALREHADADPAVRAAIRDVAAQVK